MAYAVVISLKQTLEPHLDPSRSRLQIPESEVREIYDDLCYLKSFFDKMTSLKDSNSVEDLEKEIKDVLQSIRDLIECHLSDLLLLHSVSDISTAELAEKLAEAKARLGSLIILLKPKEDFLTGGGQQSSAVAPDVPISSKFGPEMIVGMEDEVTEVKKRILRGDSSRLVLSITGIDDIGKTSLAQKVYLDPQIMEHFDIRSFVTVGLEYELEEVYQLHRSLWGRRYLVVLDDVRDTRAWGELQQFFPDSNEGSAIILTTRTTAVARGACSKENILLKRFLSDTESWELLCKMSHPEADKNAPKPGLNLAKLKETGKKIARKCFGVPLVVVEIGHVLSNSPPSVENWEAVDRGVSPLIQETIIPKILKPSYAELPHQLKTCFLYLGIFPPNYIIPTSQLFKLWAAEGFINVTRDEDERLEEKAEEYLEYLVSRFLVEVHERSWRGGIKSCRVPLLFHYVCVREAREDKLFHVVKMGNGNVAQGIEEQRRLGIHNNILLGLKQVRNMMRLATDARSLLCVGSQDLRTLQPCLELRRLRVLHALSIRFWEFPIAVARLIGLKYLAITFNGELPSSIFRLWNLETLIISPSQRVHPSVTLPLEIWKLRKLRHLSCLGFDLPDPRDSEMGDSLFLDKLLTLSGVSAGSCIVGILSRLPRLIKIGIWFEYSTHHAVEELFADDDPVFSRLEWLDSFKCVFTDLGFGPQGVVSNLTVFPSSLKKLTLCGCGFHWGLMTGIGRLPQLQVLKLQSSAFCGPEWTLVEGEFQSLKYLVLEDLDVELMEADSVHFPRLEHLLIRRCYKLQEIPLNFAEITTLSVIEVEDCSPTVIESARLMQEEQEKDYGEEDTSLKVLITSSWDRW